MTPSKLIHDGRLHRKNNEYENLKGVIFYADVDDKDIERHNLELFVEHNIPCFPDPKVLLGMQDRHEVLEQCVNWGFAKDDREFITSDQFFFNGFPIVNFPVVIKTGNSHRGIDKYLVSNLGEIPEWEGIATVEPYYEGESCRLLVIGEEVFGARYNNSESWIKNSVGCEVEEIPDSEIPGYMKQSALELTERFGLEIAGIDYIVKDGNWEFIEINQYPGLDMYDRQVESAKRFLRVKMDKIEGK